MCDGGEQQSGGNIGDDGDGLLLPELRPYQSKLVGSGGGSSTGASAGAHISKSEAAAAMAGLASCKSGGGACQQEPPALEQLAAMWPEGAVSALFTAPRPLLRRASATAGTFDAASSEAAATTAAPTKGRAQVTRGALLFGWRPDLQYDLEGVAHAIEALRRMHIKQVDRRLRLLVRR